MEYDGSVHANSFFSIAKKFDFVNFFLCVLYDNAIHLAKRNLFCLTRDKFKKSKLFALSPIFCAFL